MGNVVPFSSHLRKAKKQFKDIQALEKKIDKLYHDSLNAKFPETRRHNILQAEELRKELVGLRIEHEIQMSFMYGKGKRPCLK